MFSIKTTFITLAATAAIALTTSSEAAVWMTPHGIVVGNICQTPVGWQVVPPRPVGAACYSPAFGRGGFIAGY